MGSIFGAHRDLSKCAPCTMQSEVEISDPTRPYDGLFFIARMERGEQIQT
jgi:hypothetical protein